MKIKRKLKIHTRVGTLIHIFVFFPHINRVVWRFSQKNFLQQTDSVFDIKINLSSKVKKT